MQANTPLPLAIFAMIRQIGSISRSRRSTRFNYRREVGGKVQVRSRMASERDAGQADFLAPLSNGRQAAAVGAVGSVEQPIAEGRESAREIRISSHCLFQPTSSAEDPEGKTCSRRFAPSS